MVDLPRLELVRLENPLNRLRGDRVDNPLLDRRTSQLGTRPQRQGSVGLFTNRSPHLRMILRVLPTCRATEDTLCPSASNSTIVARSTSRCAMRWLRIRARSSACSFGVNSIRIGVLLT